MSYLHTKFHDNWISSFRGVAMTRFWDGQTDGRTDGRSDCTPGPAFAFGDAGKKKQHKIHFLSVPPPSPKSKPLLNNICISVKCEGK